LKPVLIGVILIRVQQSPAFFPKKALNTKSTGSHLSSYEKTGIPDFLNHQKSGKDPTVNWNNFLNAPFWSIQ